MNNIKNILEKSFKKLFSEGLFHMLVSNNIPNILMFLIVIILVKRLNYEEYNDYTIANNITSTILFFCGFGVNYGFMHFASTLLGEERISLAKKVFRIGIITNILLALIIVLISIFYIDGNVSKLLVISAFIPITFYVPEFITTLYRIQEKNKEYSYYNSLLHVINFIALLLLLNIFGNRAPILSRYISSGIMIGLSLPLLLNISWKGKVSSVGIQNIDLLSFGIKSILIYNATSLFSNIDILQLNLLGYAEYSGLYKVATLLPRFAEFIPFTISMFIYPKIRNYKESRLFKSKNEKLFVAIFICFNLLISTLVWIFSEQLILMLFGKEYMGSVSLLKLYAIFYFVNASFRTVSNYVLLMYGKVNYLFISTIGFLCLNFLLNFIFAHLFGVEGIVIATIIAISINGYISSRLLFKNYG